jgi:two-component system cell cycle sensor histidine kinase/response regulator CckA
MNDPDDTKEQHLQEVRGLREQLARRITPPDAMPVKEQFLLDTLMSYGLDGIYFKDTQSRFLRINQALAARFGLADPAQAIGKSDRDFFDEAFARQTRADEEQVMRTGQPLVGKAEQEIWPDGRTTWASTTTVPLRSADGRVIGIFGVTRDITEKVRAEEIIRQAHADLERRVAERTAELVRANQDLHREIAERGRAEAALHASEAKYRCLIENLEQHIFLKDRAFRYVAANPPFCRGLGLAEPDLVGRTDFEISPRYLAEKYRADDRRVVEEGERLDLEEETLIGNQPRTIRTIKTPVRDDRGNIVGVLGIFWDITEQRQLETQLRQAQKMEAVGQLAGGIAHDFNNLLTAILGNVSLVLSSSPVESSRLLLQETELAALRASELTRKLLGFSRRSVLRLEPTNLNSAVEETLAIFRRSTDPRIRVEVCGAADLWAVRADASQISQVLMNLWLNARDAMSQGGVLRLETGNVRLGDDYPRLHLEGRAGEFVRLRVSDTGHGIAPEVRPYIFDPFFTTKEVGKGTGLGLAMVYGIVKQHGGWVECASEPGRGTCFDVYLPRCEEPAAEPSIQSPAATPMRSGGETILFVDDEAVVRNLGQETLRRAGYQVLLAADGRQALALYAREQPRIDLVILDLTMPELSGRDALRQLRSLNEQVRVLFSSGYTAEQLSESAEMGVVGFLSKPYRPQELVEAVRRALNHGKATPEKTQVTCRDPGVCG